MATGRKTTKTPAAKSTRSKKAADKARSPARKTTPSASQTSAKKGSAKTASSPAPQVRGAVGDSSRRVLEVVLIILFWALALITLGRLGSAGKVLYGTLSMAFGSYTILLLLGGMLFGLYYLWSGGRQPVTSRFWWGCTFLGAAWCMMAGLLQIQENQPWELFRQTVVHMAAILDGMVFSWSGFLGAGLDGLFVTLFSMAGAWIFAAAFAITGITLMGWDFIRQTWLEYQAQAPKLKKEYHSPQDLPPDPMLEILQKPAAEQPTLEEAMNASWTSPSDQIPSSKSSFSFFGDRSQKISSARFLGKLDPIQPSKPKSSWLDTFFMDEEPQDPKQEGLLLEEMELDTRPKSGGNSKKEETFLAESGSAQDPLDLFFGGSDSSGSDSSKSDCLPGEDSDNWDFSFFPGASVLHEKPKASSNGFWIDFQEEPKEKGSEESWPMQLDFGFQKPAPCPSSRPCLGMLDGMLEDLGPSEKNGSCKPDPLAASTKTEMGDEMGDIVRKEHAVPNRSAPQAAREKTMAAAGMEMAQVQPASRSRLRPQQQEGQDSLQPVKTLPAASSTDLSRYKMPKLNLLNEPGKIPPNNANAIQAREDGVKLISILGEFGVKAELNDIHIGPSVTKFEITPGVGVRVNSITNLQNDIKMALAATDIRIEAPIPGKSAVGIEVPNVEKMEVSMRDLLRTLPSKYSGFPLMFALGKDLMGENVYGRLDTMPHLLIAGATGSGKSVCVNAIISSILMRTRPDEVKMILIDPKKVEFTPYNGVPHLLSPVITDGDLANKALQVVVAMMDRRYDLFEETMVRNISAYNAYVEQHPDTHYQKLPRIVVIIDELADLMLAAAKEVEQSIQRITQLARAAGIHLIVATQRPSVNVITGVIKANIPSRIAFAVSSAVDSRTILDQAGAERLLGYGDMLFLDNGDTAPRRIQGVFIKDEEVMRIAEYVKSQAAPAYDDAFITLKELQSQGGPVAPQDLDPLYEEVRHFVVTSQKASTSLIQRRFSIGYARAARLLDSLEVNGIIGPANGSKPREILVTSAYGQQEDV